MYKTKQGEESPFFFGWGGVDGCGGDVWGGGGVMCGVGVGEVYKDAVALATADRSALSQCVNAAPKKKNIPEKLAPCNSGSVITRPP